MHCRLKLIDDQHTRLHERNKHGCTKRVYVGSEVGCNVGVNEGDMVGSEVGIREGNTLGCTAGKHDVMKVAPWWANLKVMKLAAMLVY